MCIAQIQTPLVRCVVDLSNSCVHNKSVNKSTTSLQQIVCLQLHDKLYNKNTHTRPFNGLWSFVHFTCLTVLSYNLSPGPLWSSSWSWTLNFILHTISSPNHHLLFAAHAHTNAACSAAIPTLCHLYLVSTSTPYLGVCLLA